MPIVIRQEIPAELIERAEEIMYAMEIQGHLLSEEVKPLGIIKAREEKKRSKMIRYIERLAEMKAKIITGTDKGERYKKIRSEIIRDLKRKSPDSSYFTILYPVKDILYRIELTSVLDEYQEEDQYFDPNRRQSKITDETWGTPYNTTELEQKKPGWSGQVIDQVFKPLFSIQRYLQFAIPPGTTRELLAVAMIEMDGTISATSSRRGNKIFFAPHIVQNRVSQNGNTLPYKVRIKFVNKKPVQDLEINEENIDGWEQQVEVHDIFTFEEESFPPILTTNWYCWIEIGLLATGIYFSGNDWVDIDGDISSTILI